MYETIPPNEHTKGQGRPCPSVMLYIIICDTHQVAALLLQQGAS